MHQALQPKGRGLASIESCVDASKQELEHYNKKVKKN